MNNLSMKENEEIPSSYQEILKRYYESRLVKNSSYSLAAFARDLEISLAHLSSILKGSRGLSIKSGERIAEKLNLAKDTKEIFIDYVQAKHSRNYLQRRAAEIRIASRSNKNSVFVTADVFEAISDWHHFAILEFLNISEFKSDHRWIAKNLGISADTCRDAIERLLRIGILQEKNGQWKSTGGYVMGPDEVKSEAIKKFHQQVLGKALEALGQQSVENREFGSVLFTMSVEDVPEAKQMIKNFRKKFSKHFRSREQKNSLYNLSMQFFRMDRP